MTSWRSDVLIKKKMLLRSRYSYDLLLSISGEFEDETEWQNQVKYWQQRYKFKLLNRHTLVKTVHVTTKDGDVVQISPPGKEYIYPREQVCPLSCDETDQLLNVEVSSGCS
jgi:hypothetical protein